MNLKKPKFWDYKTPNFISNLLFPLSKLVEFKSFFFKKKKVKFKEIKSICIGNIYLGGTGKTSLAIKLKRILDEQNVKSCFIKKNHPNQIDEQKLLEKFGKTFVNKSRLQALKDALSENFKVAIFDDGLQDKSISYDLSFVCFNKKNFIGNGRIIPAGPLREPLRNVEKYKNIFLNGNDEDVKSLEDVFNQNYSNLNFYKSRYEPLDLIKFNLKAKYIVFSGIGNHHTFVDMLKKNNFKILKDFEFSDHYNYKPHDIKRITKLAFRENAQILTTQKDYLRLSKNLQLKINYIKVELKIDQLDKLKKELIEII